MSEFANIRSEARSTLAEQMRVSHARERVVEDGVLRIATKTTGTIAVGLSMLSYNAGRIIVDPDMIMRVVELGIPFEIITGSTQEVEGDTPRKRRGKQTLTV